MRPGVLHYEGIAVNPQELQGKFARLRAELASLGGCGDYSEARYVRLAFELEQTGRQLKALGLLAQTAPTLQDVVEAGAASS